MKRAQIPILQLEHVCKKFRGFEIKDISFTLEAGYILGVIGRNGAGKTTLMKLIQNITCKKSGTILVNGMDSEKEEVAVKNFIGFIMDRAFLDGLSLEDNGKEFGKFYDKYHHELFLKYLKQFQLNESQEFGKLSKGMQTKFQLAFALAHEAKLLIMDEPTGGLDPIFRREFLSLVQKIVEKETVSVIISTHITSDLDKIADYIAMIDRGQLCFFQTKEELLDTYCLVKGSIEVLRKIPKPLFVSIRKYREGFVGLTVQRNKIEELCTDTDLCIFEKATIEDIMYYSTKEFGE